MITREYQSDKSYISYIHTYIHTYTHVCVVGNKLRTSNESKLYLFQYVYILSSMILGCLYRNLYLKKKIFSPKDILISYNVL